MEINPQLITWLKWHSDNGERDITLNMMKDGDLADVPTTKVMLDECLRVGLIQVTGIELYNGTMPRYIHYKLSDIGEIALSIPPQPATRTPDAASGATGDWHIAEPTEDDPYYRVENTKWTLRTETLSVSRAMRSVLNEYEEQLAVANRERDTMQDSIDDLNHMVNEARAERDSLKAQLAECQHAHELASTQRDAANELYDGKHGRLEEVKRELEVSRDARKALEKVIRDAVQLLSEADASDKNALLAYNILQGYAQAD